MDNLRLAETINTAQIPDKAFPIGSSLKLIFEVTGFDLTGKTVYFAMRGPAHDDPLFTVDSGGSYVDLTDQTITVDIPPSALSGALTFDEIQEGRTLYRVDVGNAPVELRFQGDVYWIQEEGAWKQR